MHSTYHATIDLIDQISHAIDSKKYSIGIFLDLSKAFDTVDHNILLSKLSHYGLSVNSISWFTSYLNDRKQYTSLLNPNSYLCNISCGVPQGSILGPLLFLIYIDDLPNVRDILNIIIFADDTNFLYSHQNPDQLKNIVNQELKKSSAWFEANRLSLNPTKTKAIIFRSANKHFNPVNASININNKNIKQVTSTKFLGVIVDHKLNCNEHINIVASKIAKSIGIINKIETLFSQKILLTFILYNGIPLPVLLQPHLGIHIPF